MGILKGFSESLAQRGVQTDLIVAGAFNAGALFMLGSNTGYVQVASQAVMFVLDWDVTIGGLQPSDILLGAELQKTPVSSPARLRPLAVGDLIKDDFLASGSDFGAITGQLAPNTALTVEPSTGKLRQATAVGDVTLFKIASDGGNLFDTEGAIWAECVRLS